MPLYVVPLYALFLFSFCMLGLFLFVFLSLFLGKMTALQRACCLTYDLIYKDNMLPYVGPNLQGFDNSRKTITTQFLVINCNFIYNCTIGHPTMVELGAVSSIVHLKVKYHLKIREIAIVHAIIEAKRRCFMTSLKSQ